MWTHWAYIISTPFLHYPCLTEYLWPTDTLPSIVPPHMQAVSAHPASHTPEYEFHAFFLWDPVAQSTCRWLNIEESELEMADLVDCFAVHGLGAVDA
jgi:hypothetical protein